MKELEACTEVSCPVVLISKYLLGSRILGVHVPSRTSQRGDICRVRDDDEIYQ